MLAAFDEVVQKAHSDQRDSVRRLLAVEGDDSPLAVLRNEVVREMRDQLVEVKTDLKQISERIAVDAAVAPVVAITTKKGFTFEDVLAARLDELVAPHGDTSEQTGNIQGSGGGKQGDSVVTLAREDTAGAEGRIVFEAKNRSVTMRAILAELEDSMTNRDAQAAVAVFSSQDLAPTRVGFHYSENRAIVVLDEHGDDTTSLRLAYMWARWVVRRTLHADGATDGVDVERMQRLVEDASRAIERCKAIRGANTKAIKAIEDAGSQLTCLQREAVEALDRLRDELQATEA